MPESLKACSSDVTMLNATEESIVRHRTIGAALAVQFSISPKKIFASTPHLGRAILSACIVLHYRVPYKCR
jgi:hypothetical protein